MQQEKWLAGHIGLSNDIRNLTELANSGDEKAKLAIDIFCYRIRKYIGSYAAVLGTVDAVIFTGGIGENAVQVREKICSGLDQIGIQFDSEKNSLIIGNEGEISTNDSSVKVFVIPANEEAAIAKDTYQLVLEKVLV